MIQAGAMKAGLDLTTKFGPRLWRGIQNVGKGVLGWLGKSKDVAGGGAKWMWKHKVPASVGAATLWGLYEWLFDGDEELVKAVAEAKVDNEARDLILAKVGEAKLETELSKPENRQLILNMAEAKHKEEIDKLLLNEAKRQDELNAAQHEKALHQQMTPLQKLFTDPDLESKHTPSAMEGLRDQLKVEDKIRYEYDSRRGHGSFNKLTVPEQADMQRRWFLNNTGTYGNQGKRPFTSRDIGEAYREGPVFALDTPTGTSEATSQPRARKPRQDTSALDTPTPRPPLVVGNFNQIREPLTTGEAATEPGEAATEPGEKYGWRDLLDMPRELGAAIDKGFDAYADQGERQLKTLGDTLGGWRDDFKQWAMPDEQGQPALSPRAQRLLELQQRQQNTDQISPYLERGLREIRNVGVENMAD